jgi:hypothetical protein
MMITTPTTMNCHSGSILRMTSPGLQHADDQRPDHRAAHPAFTAE